MIRGSVLSAYTSCEVCVCVCVCARAYRAARLRKMVELLSQTALEVVAKNLDKVVDIHLNGGKVLTYKSCHKEWSHA